MNNEQRTTQHSLLLLQTCVNNQREQIEDEQLHVNAGLSKLRQTQENVAELKTSLSAKTIELREKEALANSKLQQMVVVADQNEAQKRKEEAEKMSLDLDADRQQVAIAEQKEKAQSELDEAEPALNSAKSSVQGIKKRDLDEIRNLSVAPPPPPARPIDHWNVLPSCWAKRVSSGQMSGSF